MLICPGSYAIKLAVALSLNMYILVGTFDRGCGGEIAIGEE